MNAMYFSQLLTLAFLAGLAALLLILMLNGRIRLQGLLRDKWDGGISPGRIQALMFTLAGSIGYLLNALGRHATGALPPVPGELLALLGSSNGLYLTGKLGSLLQRKFNFNRTI